MTEQNEIESNKITVQLSEMQLKENEITTEPKKIIDVNQTKDKRLVKSLVDLSHSTFSNINFDKKFRNVDKKIAYDRISTRISSNTLSEKNRHFRTSNKAGQHKDVLTESEIKEHSKDFLDSINRLRQEFSVRSHNATGKHVPSNLESNLKKDVVKERRKSHTLNPSICELCLHSVTHLMGKNDPQPKYICMCDSGIIGKVSWTKRSLESMNQKLSFERNKFKPISSLLITNEKQSLSSIQCSSISEREKRKQRKLKKRKHKSSLTIKPDPDSVINEFTIKFDK